MAPQCNWRPPSAGLLVVLLASTPICIKSFSRQHHLTARPGPVNHVGGRGIGVKLASLRSRSASVNAPKAKCRTISSNLFSSMDDFVYEGYTTFKAKKTGSLLTVTFDFPPVNVQGLPMLADLNKLADNLEEDRNIKVVVFDSANPEIFVCHADTDFLKDMSTVAVSREEVELLDLQATLERVSQLPQATICKIEGYARGGGHEFCLACDMRFAARGKAKFMQMEVGMGILPCGGGASRMARQVGLGRALEIVLSARDFDADEAEAYGTINKALDPDKIGSYVDNLADRISKWPAESIISCKRTVYASIDLPIDAALKEEAYWLYQATSKTPAIKRFKWANDEKWQEKMENQHAWEEGVVTIQGIE